MLSMKVVSFNARGLGGGEKRAEIRRLVNEKHPFVLCIQETKLSVIDDWIIKYLWAVSPYGFSYQPSSGASGGLVTIWDSTRIDVWCSMSFGHTLIIKGSIIQSGEHFVLVNVYAPCDLLAKRVLWERLTLFVNNNNDVCLCVCGDFNSVRSIDERKGRGVGFRQADADCFNKFIDDSFLIDLPICGRLFTWYRGDGVSMSRLDRFLLSDKWCGTWPNCIQVAYQRGLSDHVPLMLHVDVANWGPRPLRMIKCWADFPGYDDFVREKWGSLSITGRAGFVLQQKLKSLKLSLKGWHQTHTKNMDSKILGVKNRIAQLDEKGEHNVLLDVEITELHDLSISLHSLSRVQNSITWQQSRLHWLHEGDANTKFFHGLMSQRRRYNSINLVSVDGVGIEGVQNIRAAVFNHFSSHFQVLGGGGIGLGCLVYHSENYPSVKLVI